MPKHDLKSELSQLSFFKKEVQLLDDQLCREQERQKKINSNFRTDSVRGSMKDYPYILHTISVSGLDDGEIAEKAQIRDDMKNIKKQLNKQPIACLTEYKRLYGFIANVEDSEMRQILTLRYVYGNEWQEIADHLGGKAMEDSVRKSHERFLEKF